MKTMERKTTAKNDDFLTTVARSIGSTLGHVAAKVNATTHSSRSRTAGRTRSRKNVSGSPGKRRVSASISKRGSKVARFRTKRHKKSAK